MATQLMVCLLQSKPTQIRRTEAFDWLDNREEFFRVHQDIEMQKSIELFEK